MAVRQAVPEPTLLRSGVRTTCSPRKVGRVVLTTLIHFRPCVCTSSFVESDTLPHSIVDTVIIKPHDYTAILLPVAGFIQTYS